MWLALVLLPAAARAQDAPTIAIGGDVIYDGHLAYQLRHRAEDIGRAEAYREVFSDLTPALRSADLALVNLEVPVSPRYRERDELEDAPVFAAPPDFLDALREAGVSAFTVANNHAYDQGVRGLRHTLRAVAARELVAIGAGEDASDAARAVTIPVGAARIAIAAWTEGSNHRPRAVEGDRPRIARLSDETIAESIRAARADADLVIAVFHWTQEDEVAPRPLMRARAREAAESGADLVVGHGTHVPGRTEVIETSDGRRVTVLYSLGNLLASMEEPAGTLESREVGVRDAPLAIVSTRWSGGRLEVADVQVRDHWIARPTPDAPWLPEGRLAVSRTVAIDAELGRIREAACGEPCDARARAYRHRAVLIHDAMRELGSAADDSNDADDPRPVLDRPPPRRRRAPRPSADARLAPYLRGAAIAVTFADGGAIERSADVRTIAEIAALMRADHGLRAEVIVSAPDERLASLRAHRVKGLIAMRGPSRSRFELRARVTDHESVVVRLVRTHE